MLNDTLFRVPRKAGIHVLQQRGDRGATELTTRRIQLGAGSAAELDVPDEEAVVVIQQGAATLIAGGQTWKVRRADVFSERATAVYLPPGMTLQVRADSPF